MRTKFHNTGLPNQIEESFYHRWRRVAVRTIEIGHCSSVRRCQYFTYVSHTAKFQRPPLHSTEETMNQSHQIFRSFTVLLLVVPCAQLAAAERPNILIIFTDDQGYADLACYGSKKNKTPRLDQLAREGTRFTSFYSQTVCGPSRSALLTGRYPIRSKGWGMPASEITFAELMREAGYQTACIGKWDVSNRKAIIERMPNAQGFDYYFGTLGANDGGGVTFHENNARAGSTRDMGSLTTLYTDKAITFLQNKRDPARPFVLYVAHTMMHTIINASDRFSGQVGGRTVR